MSVKSANRNYCNSTYFTISAKPYKYEANEELPVVIAPFMKNTDFMRVSGVQTSKMGKVKL